jgi:hypothetical protein
MNPYILLIVGAMGLVGCLILLFMGLSMLRNERASKEAPASGAAAIEPVSVLAAGPPAPGFSVASAPVPDVPAATTSTATMSRSINPLANLASRMIGARTRASAHEVLRVLRDNLTGRVLIEVAGMRYSNLSDILDEAVRAGLATTLRDLETFGGAQALETGPQQPASPPAASAGQPSSAGGQPAAPRLAPDTRRPLTAGDAPAGAASESRRLPPPTMNPFRQMAVLREMAKNPPPPPKSIAEQIDEVLQQRIIGTPLIHRAIHMRPGPRGDAVFEVDGNSYTGVDEVPDDTVRDVIRAAITEWEHTQ